MMQGISLRPRLPPITEEVLQVLTCRLSVFLTGSDIRVNKNVQVTEHVFRLTRNTFRHLPESWSTKSLALDGRCPRHNLNWDMF
jgi:hypothetical protein